ncbi:Hypp3467 [Branchiostoma lanceolatum]|uniref:Hypp3467 protein n=1 Tax=Branchiostoma lanceolatum TaxID=7740 RepID=A0A8K0EUL3_BRALA|nr:Hypp3467 [Branchiostoma lanceolatum]
MIRSARLRLFGHIARADPPLEPAALLREPTPTTWTRPRGRPRRTWGDRPHPRHRLGGRQRQINMEDHMQGRYAPLGSSRS